MVTILAATAAGALLYSDTKETRSELPGRRFTALGVSPDDTCLAVLEDREIWSRNPDGAWTHIASTDINLQSITSTKANIFCGGMDEAAIIRISSTGVAKRLPNFDRCPGRKEWFANGPPLGVRSLTATRDGAALIAAVHVGGLPYSVDQGETWRPSIPIHFDVHEVRAHPTLPSIVAAAAAVGLCVSSDAGQSWQVISQGLALTSSLALTMLPDAALFCIADGPFAARSQIWRWAIGSDHVTKVRDGLPDWLEGKVDTAQMASAGDRAVILDGAGNLWYSASEARDWKHLATSVPRASGLAILL